MTDEDLEIAKKNNVVLVGTEYLALRDAKARPQWIDRLRRAYKIGVTMAYGTDVIDEVERETRGTLSISGIDPWIEAGIPPKVLLQAMTMNAARLLGVEKERGAIHIGMAADIIATEGNPLNDASALKKVVFVMKNGVAIKQ